MTHSDSIEERVGRAATRLASSRARCSRSHGTLERSEWLLALTEVVLTRQPLIRGGGESPVSQTAVLERLRSLVESGVLPLVRPTRVWAGPCREAHACIGCGTIIGVGETEFDLVLASADKVFFHPRCMNLWPDAGLGGVAAAS